MAVPRVFTALVTNALGNGVQGGVGAVHDPLRPKTAEQVVGDDPVGDRGCEPRAYHFLGPDLLPPDRLLIFDRRGCGIQMGPSCPVPVMDPDHDRNRPHTCDYHPAVFTHVPKHNGRNA